MSFKNTKPATIKRKDLIIIKEAVVETDTKDLVMLELEILASKKEETETKMVIMYLVVISGRGPVVNVTITRTVDWIGTDGTIAIKSLMRWDNLIQGGMIAVRSRLETTMMRVLNKIRLTFQNLEVN